MLLLQADQNKIQIFNLGSEQKKHSNTAGYTIRIKIKILEIKY